MYSNYFFNVLKERVLAKAGIKHLIPSECQKLSTYIFASTKKTVSETTLKRIYGFAVSKFNPSPFTLQALSEYCSYDSWEAFCNQEDVSETIPTEKNTWNLMCKRANRTTQFTLQCLKKRSGIPFNFTIKRKFITDHFNAFLQTDQTITFFVSQAGFGKTIGLCHMVEDLLNANTINTYDKNVVLFFSTHTINNINSDNLNFSEWFLSFLGFPSINSLIDLFEENESDKTNFYLIIDEFDDISFKTDQYFTFFNQLIDIISYYSKYPWFKIVLTMQSSTWINYKYLLEDKPVLREKWFSGFMLDESETTNVLPFSTDEILTLSQNINPQLNANFSPVKELIQKLSYPLFFQLYYQNNSHNFNITETDYLSFYQVISAFTYSKIYQGKNSMEKILMLKAFLEMVDYTSNSFSVSKIRFYEYSKLYPHIYKELIGNAIIQEENFSRYLQYQEHISFTNSVVFEYCLAKKFHFWNNEKFDQNLINEIEQSLGKSTVKIPVLKWIMFFIINSNDYNQFNYLQYLNLESLEKQETIIFTCNLLEKQLSDIENYEKLNLYFSQIQHNLISGFFISLQYISTDYEKALHTLLKFNLSDKNKILIYTTLALINIFSLNAAKAEYYIEEINVFPDHEIEGFIINPLHCLDAIFSYLKYGIIRKESLQTLTHFYNNHNLQYTSLAVYNYNEVILELALLTLRLNDNPQKELKFIQLVSNNFKAASIKEDVTLTAFYAAFEADAYIRLGNFAKAFEIQNQLLKIQNPESDTCTPFIKTLANLLTIKNAAYNQYDKITLLQVKTLIAYSKNNKFNLAGVYMAINYLNAANLISACYQDVADLYNYVLKTLRLSGFKLESFITIELQNKIQFLINEKSANSLF
ncbi:MAG: hypothetical protein EOP43_01190 [Sphingobacteriaceae bacterium]|nr:MAG: hypothetical protein EOP43_01190 [Sphingobacteriaceae bacterium]